MEYRSTLETALQLARDERTEEALSILDQSLATPSLMKTPRQFVLIARNAAVLSEGLGDLNRAADYYGRALGLTPEDASLMLALGQIYRRLGDAARAEMYLRDSEAAGLVQNDQETLAIVRELKKSWNP